ncbi:TOBE domain protein [Beutenbergia cavernae DSM 12333]|uniref:TOBE domain protein n=1 Tax=Beutenbergia cavernae (strain ATCC BAA-8 / DSM 12333 / CCUG 43141 / JCM 11478 / NBRC 16432 / NCIMB 13614 / HKI 0122) TaxID=471853 RepID=C5C1M2_BEUC1|nr:helix-turn-helix transcriptional regulator [Beutenbergia cavernae]ACQ79490.1 TOBE domain protein [Beutenbergia cavernae DSM 12333]
MTQYRISEAAQLLGVSDDTVRRWIDAATLPSEVDQAGRRVIAGEALAARAVELARPSQDPTSRGTSARNRFAGIVTKVTADAVMAQVELQCGPHRVVSLMSSEAVRELGLAVGERAVAVVKATTVIVETPEPA